MAKAGAALCALLLLAAGVAGCGEEEGVADGASVTAYAERPVCENGDTGRIAQFDTDGGSFELRLVCLPSARREGLSQGVGGGRQVDLAIAGANARRATEDSTTVAYLQPEDPAVNRFVEPILEAAGVGWITASRSRAQSELLRLLGEADPSNLRADVREALGQS